MLLNLFTWATKSGISSPAQNQKAASDCSQKQEDPCSSAQPSECQLAAETGAASSNCSCHTAEEDVAPASTAARSVQAEQPCRATQQAESREDHRRRAQSKGFRQLPQHAHIVRPSTAALQPAVSCPESAAQLPQPHGSCRSAACLRSHSLCLDRPELCSSEVGLEEPEAARKPSDSCSCCLRRLVSHPLGDGYVAELPDLDRLQSHSLCLSASEAGSTFGSSADLASVDDSLADTSATFTCDTAQHSNGSHCPPLMMSATSSRDMTEPSSPSGSESGFEDALEAQVRPCSLLLLPRHCWRSKRLARWTCA